MKHNYASVYLQLLLFLFTGVWEVSAQTLDPDYIPALKQPAAIFALAKQADNKIIVGGRIQFADETLCTSLVRLNSDGSYDASFIPDIQIYFIQSLALQRDGKVLIGGTFTLSGDGGNVINGLIRLNRNGTVDDTFQHVTITATGVPYAIAVQNDDKILLGGRFQEVNGIPIHALVRLHSDGTIDNTFASPDHSRQYITAIAVQADGKVLLSGSFNLADPQLQRVCIRLNTDGSLDTDFISNIPDYLGIANTIHVDSKNRILVGGYIYNSSWKQLEFGLFRVDIDGNTDHSFKLHTVSQPKSRSGTPFSILSQSDDKIILNGYFYEYLYPNALPVIHHGLTRLNEDGSLDELFERGIESNAVSQAANTILLLDDQKILLANSADSYNNVAGNSIFRVNTDGSVDQQFTTDLQSIALFRSLTFQSDGKSIIAGDVNSVNGKPVNGICRLNIDGTRDSTFKSAGTSYMNWRTSLQKDGKILSIINATIKRFNLDGSEDTSFNSELLTGGNYWTLAAQDDGRILVAGQSARFNGIMRLHPDGSIDDTFLKTYELNGAISQITVQKDGKILLSGWFSTFNNAPISRILRLNSDGSLDDTFTANAAGSNPGSIAAIVLQNDGKILIGGYIDTAEGQVYQVARLSSDGTIDPAFNAGSGPNGGINSIALRPDGKILVGGGFTSFNGISTKHMVMLNTDGSVAQTFNIEGNYAYVSYISTQPDGNVVIAGNFLYVDGQVRYGIARFLFPCMQPAKPTITSNGNATSATFTLSSSSEQGNQWLKDGVEISEATSQSYNVTQAGSYSVRVTVNNCVNIADSDPVVLTGKESAPLAKLQVFPNPTTDKLQVQYTGMLKEDMVHVYNLLGMKVAQFPLTQQAGVWQGEISLQHLPSQAYVLRIIATPGSVSQLIHKY